MLLLVTNVLTYFLNFLSIFLKPFSAQFSIPYRNQLFDLHRKLNDWFLYEIQHWAEMIEFDYQWLQVTTTDDKPIWIYKFVSGVKRPIFFGISENDDLGPCEDPESRTFWQNMGPCKEDPGSCEDSRSIILWGLSTRNPVRKMWDPMRTQDRWKLHGFFLCRQYLVCSAQCCSW